MKTSFQEVIDELEREVFSTAAASDGSQIVYDSLMGKRIGKAFMVADDEQNGLVRRITRHAAHSYEVELQFSGKKFVPTEHAQLFIIELTPAA